MPRKPRNEELIHESGSSQDRQAQVAALAGGAKLVMPPPEIADRVARQFSRPGYQETKGEWRALLRMLDKADRSYRD